MGQTPSFDVFVNFCYRVLAASSWSVVRYGGDKQRRPFSHRQRVPLCQNQTSSLAASIRFQVLIAGLLYRLQVQHFLETVPEVFF